MTKLASFDSERFLLDVEKELAKKGKGARTKMAERCGLSSGALSYIFTNRRVSEIETIMSMARYCGLIAFQYVSYNPMTTEVKKGYHDPPSKIIDWKLFGQCCSMICWGKSSILAAKVPGLKNNQAAAILKGNGTGHAYFRYLCKLLKVDEKEFLRADRRYPKLTPAQKRKRRRSLLSLQLDFDSASLS